MEVRRARIEDAARIAEIHVRTWQAAYRGIIPDSLLDCLSISKRQTFWEDRLAANEVEVLVAAAGDAICGWLAYGRSRDADTNPAVAEVYGLYVDATAWRCGAGTLLWNHARDRMTETNIEYVTLWVLEANTRARRFYEAMGFQHETGQVKQFQRENTILPEVRYRTRLR
jgi:ribosomal protein S18 acetylase RimI-like enzyme